MLLMTYSPHPSVDKITIQVRLFGVDLPPLRTTTILISHASTVEQILRVFLDTAKLEDMITLEQLGESVFLFNNNSIQITDTVNESGELYILRPLGGG